MADSLESVKSWPQATRDYVGELQAEMRRVTWPTRSQVQSTTAVVIVTVFAFAAYFKLVDFIINNTLIRLQHVLSR